MTSAEKSFSEDLPEEPETPKHDGVEHLLDPAEPRPSRTQKSLILLVMGAQDLSLRRWWNDFPGHGNKASQLCHQLGIGILRVWGWDRG